jgi:hypothetical protein
LKRTKYFLYYISDEDLLKGKKTSVRERLIWLKKANDFIRKVLSPKEIKKWKNLKSL